MINEGNETDKARPLYRITAARIERMIQEGTFRIGERLPSIRSLSQQLRVSVNTIAQAYAWLEDAHIITARPQSGHYVCAPSPKKHHQPIVKESTEGLAASHVTLGQDHLQIMRNIADSRLIPLGRGAPSTDLLPVEKLNRMLITQARYFPLECLSYAPSKGLERLRTQIAKRAPSYGCDFSPDDIIITSGCVEAVMLALHTVCLPGDTVLVESPVYYTFLNAIQWLGLKVLEIPSTSTEGMNLDTLRYAIEHNHIQACVIISNYSNPLGGLMPDTKKAELVGLLAAHNIPLIEDDVYGDLGFRNTRPFSLKAYDKDGGVILCSSFSKTLAPGYRTGWIVPGRFQAKVEGLKSLFNIATATPPQLAIAEFLSTGGYDRHLRTLRNKSRQRMDKALECVLHTFPEGTHITHPQGGYCLWIELPKKIDTLHLHEAARQKDISIAPGMLFTTSNKFKNCLRLNYSYWSDRVKTAIKTVGQIACAMTTDH